MTMEERKAKGLLWTYTEETEKNSIAVGVPCKVLREITARDAEYYYRDLRV